MRSHILVPSGLLATVLIASVLVRPGLTSSADAPHRIYLPLAGRSINAGPQPEQPVIANGGFEDGPGEWEEYSEQGWDIIYNAGELKDLTGILPRTGEWAAWLGGDDLEVASISQEVAIPANQPYLSYWYWIDAVEECGYDYDTATVEVVTTDNEKEVVQRFELCEGNNTGDWTEDVLDLTAYSGQTVRLSFWLKNDEFNFSNFFVDDVVLVSTPPS